MSELHLEKMVHVCLGGERNAEAEDGKIDRSYRNINNQEERNRAERRI